MLPFKSQNVMENVNCDKHYVLYYSVIKIVDIMLFAVVGLGRKLIYQRKNI